MGNYARLKRTKDTYQLNTFDSKTEQNTAINDLLETTRRIWNELDIGWSYWIYIKFPECDYCSYAGVFLVFGDSYKNIKMATTNSQTGQKKSISSIYREK